MNIGSFVLMTVVFALLFLLVQRSEGRRRLGVAALILLPGILIQRYANYANLHTEAQLAFALALVFNTIFWLLIGRYNPVPSSDDTIQVIGMDD